MLKEHRIAVAPFTGAWVEIIGRLRLGKNRAPSHPSRVRGLKCIFTNSIADLRPVAPFTGAWVEIGGPLPV